MPCFIFLTIYFLFVYSSDLLTAYNKNPKTVIKITDK